MSRQLCQVRCYRVSLSMLRWKQGNQLLCFQGSVLRVPAPLKLTNKPQLVFFGFSTCVQIQMWEFTLHAWHSAEQHVQIFRCDFPPEPSAALPEGRLWSVQLHTEAEGFEMCWLSWPSENLASVTFFSSLLLHSWKHIEFIPNHLLSRGDGVSLSCGFVPMLIQDTISQIAHSPIAKASTDHPPPSFTEGVRQAAVIFSRALCLSSVLCLDPNLNYSVHIGLIVD